MVCTQNPGMGFRRFDAAAAQADKVANAFTGLPKDIGTGHALAAFKRAACYLDISPSVVQLIDILFSWTKVQDWQAGQLPIVWPRNEKLARKLGIQVRQLQNLLDRAVALKLISHRDSPNGHRGGVRNKEGQIKWAYGILLSPIGARYHEFLQIAAQGAAEEEHIDRYRRRLACTRRRIASLLQTAIDHDLNQTKADEEYDLVLLATRQMRRVRDVRLLGECVEQLEARASALATVISAALGQETTGIYKHTPPNNACTDALSYTHSTTTKELQTANAATCSELSEKGGEYPIPNAIVSKSEVENDLDEHGISLRVIKEAVPGLCQTLKSNSTEWGPVVALAEQLAYQNHIHPQAWRAACQIMGERGAAASVLATVQKYRAGEVRRPGAYLRGMSDRAAKGELRLGKTFHGLKGLQRYAEVQPLHERDNLRSVGEIAQRAMAQASLVLSGRSLSRA
jgi:replication initiation protein RepC